MAPTADSNSPKRIRMTPVLEDRHWVLRALSGKYGYLLCAW